MSVPLGVDDANTTPSSRSAVIRELIARAPAGELSAAALATLRELTQALVAQSGVAAVDEYERFQSVARRSLHLDHDALAAQLGGATVLVTGGTGCIGSALIGELARYSPAQVVSLSRGVSAPRTLRPRVDYRTCDLRDVEALDDLLDEVWPDIVYHLAAQHDPGLAELEPLRTITTNILGTRNLAAAAARSGVRQLVYASTGKALRPIATDVYAASKKAGEWLMARAAADTDLLCSGARFTHVVDNSIIFDRLSTWIAADCPIRLHADGILFYLQSARESAQLLLDAGLRPTPGAFALHAIRDLQEPISLTDLAVGALAVSGSSTPIHFCGYESGYEEMPYPALYDPRTSGDVSPLISSFEAPAATPSATCPQVDRFVQDIPTTPSGAAAFGELVRRCGGDATDDALREATHALSWALLEARLGVVEPESLRRAARRAELALSDAPATNLHVRTNEVLHRALAARPLVMS